jgi:hypothetical protein
MPASLLKKRKRGPSPTPLRNETQSSVASDDEDPSSQDGSNENNHHERATPEAPASASTTNRPKGLNVNEMRTIKENTQLFKSNAFHFQARSHRLRDLSQH